jgi:hypothetical protein
MTWVLLAWWNSKGLSLMTRTIAFFFLFFTVLATLGTGEHYLIDLIVAFPFALMLQSLTSLAARRREGIVPFCFGLGAVLLWMVLLRFTPNFFWLSRAIPWTLVSATVLVAMWLKRRVQTVPFPWNSGSSDSGELPLGPKEDIEQQQEMAVAR